MMASSDYNQLGAITDYLRIRYGIKRDILGLQKFADETFIGATETITLTSQSFEGASASGSINCPKGLLLEAIMTVLREIDPASAIATAPRDRSVFVFR